MIGVIAIFFLVLLRVSKKVFRDSERLYFLRFLPESLIVVVTGIIISASLRLDKYNVRILGDFNSSFPRPSFPSVDLSTLQVAIFPAISVAIVGFVESIIVAKLYALRHNYQVSPNRELVATGLANLVSVKNIFSLLKYLKNLILYAATTLSQLSYRQNNAFFEKLLFMKRSANN